MIREPNKDVKYILGQLSLEEEYATNMYSDDCRAREETDKPSFLVV